MAPITPATALEMPPPEEEDEGEGVEDAEEVEVEDGAQMPVVLPQAEHQSAWFPIAILFIWSANVVHGRTSSVWLNKG